MDKFPNKKPNPTGAPQLLSAKFLRKTNLRRENLSNGHQQGAIGDLSSKSGHKESQVSKILAAVAVQQLATLQPEQGTKNTLNLKEHPEQPKLLASSSLSTMPTPTWSSTPSFSESSTHPGPGSLPKPVPDTSAELTFTLSPEELDLAKDLVLDLLGWGVEPEYLIDSGVSAAVIFRVFTDLNLRLPKNLKVSEELKKVAYSWGPSPFELSETSS